MTSPMKDASSEIRKGEVGYIFDATQCRVGPTERPHKDVWAGPQRNHAW